jgi:hypothetical protein
MQQVVGASWVAVEFMWDEGSKHREERQKEIVKRVERARFDASFFFFGE